jgi:hypothetical protein
VIREKCKDDDGILQNYSVSISLQIVLVKLDLILLNTVYILNCKIKEKNIQTLNFIEFRYHLHISRLIIPECSLLS